MVIAYDPMRSALYHPETQDTLFEAGKSYSPPQRAIEGARLAYYRAEESPSQLQRLTAALAAAGFTAPRLFIDSLTGAAGFGSLDQSGGTALLAFRGTQPDDVSDIAHDIDAELVPWTETAGLVHAGFAATTRSLLPKVLQWVNDTKLDTGRLIICGHSLGAAMATLATSVLKPGWLVTIGSPRVGDATFVETVIAAKTQRIVDCCDAVTRVPPAIGGYTHLPTLTYLTRNAEHLSNPSDTTLEADRLVARTEYITNHAWKIGAVLVRDLADHAPINYARAFFPEVEGLD